ncbi:MAG: hypothetical protein MUE36_08865 [Acidimicrobiales bacterium]|nr:hypothetical protein [Acidimicrobiales bacterium]
MSNVAFLLIVVVITVLGSLVLWLRHRKPTTFMSSVDEFQEEMRALGRDPQEPGSGRRTGRPRPVGPPPSRVPPPSSRRRAPEGADEQGGGR